MARIPVVVMGSGGHAGVVVEILFESRLYRPFACTSVGEGGRDLLGVTIIGGDDKLRNLRATDIRWAIPAVGDNKIRRRIMALAEEWDFELISLAADSANVSTRAIIGRGTVIVAGAIVGVNSIIGDGVIVNTAASLDHDSRVGSFTHIAPGARIAGGVSIGDECLIGMGAVVMPNLEIGHGSIVGAGSVVTKNIGPGVVAYGVPASEKSRVGERPNS